MHARAKRQEKGLRTWIVSGVSSLRITVVVPGRAGVIVADIGFVACGVGASALGGALSSGLRSAVGGGSTHDGAPPCHRVRREQPSGWDSTIQ